ncbi:MAG: hypothetical protein ACTSX8_03580 [Alphaproteobacteria bacterium]
MSDCVIDYKLPSLSVRNGASAPGVAELESRLRLGESFKRYVPVPIEADGKLHFFDRGVPAEDCITSICGHVSFGERVQVKLFGDGVSGALAMPDVDFSPVDSVNTAVKNFSRYLCEHCVARALA